MMSIKTPKSENFKINKIPLIPAVHNQRSNVQNKRRNNSKIASENNNFGKLSDSYQNKSNYKFKLSAMGSTIEVIKNTSGNNSYQNQLFANGTNEKYNDMQDAKEKLTVNKTNLRGLKIKLDKNKSFMTKNDKRDMSFNKREITPTLLKHISLRSKNKNNKSSNNNYYKHLECNSAISLVDSQNNRNKGLGIKPTYLQYDFDKLKINNNNLNAQFLSINNNISNHNFNLKINEKDLNGKNGNKNYESNNIIKENLNINKMNNIHNIKNINNKTKVNNNDNHYIKINNNVLNANNNRHHLHLNHPKMNNQNHNNNTNNNNEEYFSESNEKEIELTKEEKDIYGNRNMKNYHKKKLLGKGGCGIVWLCAKNNTKQNGNSSNINEFAVKQISKKNGNNQSLINLNLTEDNLKIARNEIKILKQLNEKNKIDEKYIYCEVLPKIYESYEDNNDIWFSFEKGGKSLSNLSYKIKGEFEKGERIYHIQKGIFLKLLFTNIKQFKLLIKKILLGIEFINGNGIIHSDIKPENILIEYIYDSDNFEITSIKIIDYGSAFHYENTSAISSNTPEYLCPEITNANKKFLKELSKDTKYINCIDIWSFGITLLELCLCCPIWMSYKSKILINDKSFYSTGYFGCRGRDGNKIYQKQKELSKNLGKILKNSLLYLMNKDDKEKFINLLSAMLEFDYKKRITIEDAINHDFLLDDDNE